MRKLLLGSFILTFFAVSVILIQISCQKESTAQSPTYSLPPATTSTLGGVIIGSGLAVTANGTLSVTCCGSNQQSKFLFVKSYLSGPNEISEIWTSNYDGTNAQKINIAVPAGMKIDGELGPTISPDRQTMFFSMSTTTTNVNHIYTCKLDGSNVTKIVDGAGMTEINIGAAY